MRVSEIASSAGVRLKWFGCKGILCAPSRAAAAKFGTSVIARDRTVVRSLAARQVEHDFIDVAPAPPLRRIVAFDHRMSGGVEMFGGVPMGRVITAADMAARPADPQ